MAKPFKILFLASNPKDSGHLRLEDESKLIDEAIQRSTAEGEYRFYNKGAVTVNDLRRAMVEIKPDLIHFSGHGSDEDTLYFEDDEGYTKEVSSDDLGLFFGSFKDKPECVILNACYSLRQANGIKQSISIVIGMSSAIPNDSAKIFTQHFYESLCKKCAIEEAFAIAKAALNLEQTDDGDIPQIHINKAIVNVAETTGSDNSDINLVSEKEIDLVKKIAGNSVKIYLLFILLIVSVSLLGAYKLSFDEDPVPSLASMLISLLSGIPIFSIVKKLNARSYLNLLKLEREKFIGRITTINREQIESFNARFAKFVEEKIVT